MSSARQSNAVDHPCNRTAELLSEPMSLWSRSRARNACNTTTASRSPKSPGCCVAPPNNLAAALGPSDKPRPGGSNTKTFGARSTNPMVRSRWAYSCRTSAWSSRGNRACDASSTMLSCLLTIDLATPSDNRRGWAHRRSAHTLCNTTCEYCYAAPPAPNEHWLPCKPMAPLRIRTRALHAGSNSPSFLWTMRWTICHSQHHNRRAPTASWVGIHDQRDGNTTASSQWTNHSANWHIQPSNHRPRRLSWASNLDQNGGNTTSASPATNCPSNYGTRHRNRKGDWQCLW
mmetsp:Transcript_26749/g.67256  ORF Transcript_26749/g.67256 Transcript_26749/m.67256 type:complete len:288 (-) Transcript_26749:795-1658(-)